MTTKPMMAVVLSLVALPSFLLAQDDAQLKFIEKRDAKMAHEVFQKADWIFDYDKVREQAKASGKPIFAYFTRSYAG